MTNDYHTHLPSAASAPSRSNTLTSYTSSSQPQQRPPIAIPNFHFTSDSPSSATLPRSILVDNPTTALSSASASMPFPFSFAARPAAPQQQQQQHQSQDYSQWITTSPIVNVQSSQFPFPPPENSNYHLGTPRSASSSGYASTVTDLTSSSPTHSHMDDPYFSTSLPSSNMQHIHHPSHHQSWAPSSAPVPGASDSYSIYGNPEMQDLLSSPLSAAGFYSGMAGLGLDKGTGGGTMSPREMLMSSTVVDADDFAARTPDSDGNAMIGGGDYPVYSTLGGTRQMGMGFSSSSYPGYNTNSHDFIDSGLGGSTSPLMGYNGGYAAPTNLFAPSATSPTFVHRQAPHHQQSPGMDMSTQFPLDLEDQKAPSSSLDLGSSFFPGPSAKSSPASTIRLRRRPRIDLDASVVNSAMNVKLEDRSAWPISSRSTTQRRQAFEEDDEEQDEDEEAEDEDDGDGDYIDEAHATAAYHHAGAAGPHRTMRRMSSSAAMASAGTPSSAGAKPRRPSPYSRTSRPSAAASRRHSHSDLKASTTGTTASPSTTKKVKAVKWESTKPKYWIPEGFDPWWDQKSRGRGVATVSTSAPDDVVAGEAAWPADYLPEDWRELVRGKGNASRPFVCPAVNCGKTFQRSEHAKRHAWSLHTPDAAKVSCPYEGCDHKSTRGDNLKQHIGSHKRKVLPTSTSSSAPSARRRSGGGAGGRRTAVKHEDADADEEQAWP